MATLTRLTPSLFHLSQLTTTRLPLRPASVVPRQLHAGDMVGPIPRESSTQPGLLREPGLLRQPGLLRPPRSTQIGLDGRSRLQVPGVDLHRSDGLAFAGSRLREPLPCSTGLALDGRKRGSVGSGSSGTERITSVRLEESASSLSPETLPPSQLPTSCAQISNFSHVLTLPGRRGSGARS